MTAEQSELRKQILALFADLNSTRLRYRARIARAMQMVKALLSRDPP